MALPTRVASDILIVAPGHALIAAMDARSISHGEARTRLSHRLVAMRIGECYDAAAA